MHRTALRTLPSCSLVSVLLMLATSGCGSASALSESKPDSGTLNSSIAISSWGTFELITTGQNPNGRWGFAIRSSRIVARNQLRFVWDFGNGPEGEGLYQSHVFTEAGGHEVNVTAYNLESSVEFILTLVLDIGGDLPPVALANAVEWAVENQVVDLDGTGSYDPEGASITVQWEQTSGIPVELQTQGELSASFVAPQVDADEELKFRLTVRKGSLSSSAEVAVRISDAGAPSDPDGLDATISLNVDMDGNGVVDEADARIACVDSAAEWNNFLFVSQNGIFESRFVATPSHDFMDAVMGLSAASSTQFTGLAMLVRFNPAGAIDVRNGGWYDAEQELFYSANTEYEFRVVVNVPERTYDVYVTPPGDEEVQIAAGYDFRTEQNSPTSVGNWSLWSDVGTTLKVCHMAILPSRVTAHAGSNVTISPGGGTVLDGRGAGGQEPYSYRWSPQAGLSNPAIANPVATPTTTTTYRLTVTDIWGSSDWDEVVVTVRETALDAKAGPDKQISAGESTTLEGSASGGRAPYEYKWSPSKGLSSSTDPAPTARPESTTTYTLTVTDSTGATDTDSVVVTVTGGTISGAFVVAKNASNASDSNPGTEEAPWKTLAKAAAAAKAGQTVLIKEGIYYETLKPAASGTADGPIVFRAYPGDECKGAFAGTKSDCRVVIDGQNSRGNGIDASPRKFVRFEGFEIRNHSSDGVYFQGYYDTTADGLELVNCFVHHNGNDAVSFRGVSRNCTVENCELTQNPQTGISFGNGSGHILRGNNIHYNGKDGIRGGGDNLLIELNNMYDQFHTDLHPDGMDLGDMSNSVLRYNTISDFTQLMYFHDYDNGGGFINLQIYGNVFYTDRYWTVKGGEAPGIFFDASFNNSPIKNVKIHSNTFVWTGYNGIIMYGGPLEGVVICNNIFYDSGVDLDGRTTGVKLDYNIFYNSRKPSNEGPNSITSNPQFVGYTRHQSWNLRLKSTSPAINKGDPELLLNMGLSDGFKDIDGVTRPSGTRCDMGAYEFNQ